MRHNLLFSVAFAALMLPGAAFAQSTGTMDFEDGDIVVTAHTDRGIGGVQVPDTTKAKAVLTQAFITHQTPGNSILDTINQLPGVSFQNNDPFGSAGGTLTVRGFDSTRVSLTFDGVPLNDAGNYASYSNQQLDPELIENVNVSLGSTDVDSPTAAASGSTINYRTMNPTDEFGARMLGSVGDFQYFRIFGQVNTGTFTSFGTKAYLAASHAENNNVYGNHGVIDKAQYNGKLYQPIGGNGDFISVSGNYNVNRNNFFGSVPLRNDLTVLNGSTLVGTRVTGGAANNRFPLTKDERYYSIPGCQVAAARPGLVDAPNGCGTAFEERFNPSNTGNIIINSRFTVAPGLVLTVDPSFQYVKANGGGTAGISTNSSGVVSTSSVAREGLRDINPSSAITTLRAGYFGGAPYAGIDLNGDGDTLDTVSLLAPSQTTSRRYGVIASLRYDIAEGQSIKIGYSFDRARTRQTGEAGFLQANGYPVDVFPVNNPIVASNGITLQKRNRLSYATLNQVSGEYRGEFMDSKLIVNLGVRAPFFKRDLNNYCFTSSAGGFVECGGSAALDAEIAAANPYVVNATTGAISGFAPGGKRTLNYSRVLPTAGFDFKFADGFAFFANYSKGIQVPGTDNLYNSYFFALSNPAAHPKAETTDNFDAGIRYNSSTVQLQVGPWFTRFTNRLASAYDPETDQTVYRNLGTVDKYGIDGQIDYRPIPEVLVHVFGSYLKSKIKDDVLLGECASVSAAAGCSSVGQAIYAPTAGKRESGAPTYTFGGRVQGQLGPLSLGVQAKRTGPRYVNDQNVGVFQCTTTVNAASNQICTGTQYQVYGAEAPAYTLVDLDARLALGWLGLNDKTYLQVNVSNVFDKLFVGGFGGNSSRFNVPNASIGVPRAAIFTLNTQF